MISCSRIRILARYFIRLLGVVRGLQKMLENRKGEPLFNSSCESR